MAARDPHPVRRLLSVLWNSIRRRPSEAQKRVGLTFRAAFRALIRRRRREAQKPVGLTAIEYEAVTLIAYEGKRAYARAREQARYCRGEGSESGFRFWSQVADEVALRTRGRIPG